MTKTENILDMRFVINSVAQNQIKEKAQHINSPFESLLSYLSESKRPNIEEITISDKIAMAIDEFLNKINFTVFYIDKLNKIRGSCNVTYEFNKEETIESLYLYSLSDDFLSHLKYYSIQYSLNQSDQTSIDEFVGSGQVYCIELDGTRRKVTGSNNINDCNSDAQKNPFKIKFQLKCKIITEADYQNDCEEEE